MRDEARYDGRGALSVWALQLSSSSSATACAGCLSLNTAARCGTCASSTVWAHASSPRFW
eukprot:362979-Chlamydomonas_euryale.AAC.9